jgi:Carboxypeptidase regulatory-like domain
MEQPLKAERRSKEKASVLKVVIFTIIGIMGVVTLGGFVVSGGILPNAHTKDAVLSSSLGQEPGKLYGFVGGSIMDLPAIGASVIAAYQETGYTSYSVSSIDGKYYPDLMPGKYKIVVAFPDGTSQTYSNVIVERRTASEMNIKY